MKTSNERIDLKFNIPKLDRTIIAILENVANKKFISQVNKLFNNLTPESYKVEWDKEVRVFLIRRLTDTILEKGYTTKEEILTGLDIDGKYQDGCTEILNTLVNGYLSPSETDMIESDISRELKYAATLRYMNAFRDKLNVIESEVYDDLDKEMDDILYLSSNIVSEMHDAKESIEDSKYDVNLCDDSMLNTYQELIDEANNPNSKIKTGIQMFNTMLDGGFEKGRCYMLLGVAKGFKSGTMLNVALQAKKYNKFDVKDPSKKPVIVYLTMENSVKETSKRINCYSYGNDFKVNSYTANQLMTMRDKAGLGPAKEIGDAELLIKYRANGKVGLDELKALLDDLNKDGKECVFLIVDYIKRMKAPDSRKDLRLQLGDIVNGLCDIAKEKDIPILSASQMNREAIKAIEQASSYEEKLAAASRLGAGQIGESIDIVQNADMCICLSRLENTSINEDGTLAFSDKTLMLNCVAARGVNPVINKFQVRFAPNNDLRLTEDIYDDKPKSIITSEEDINDRIRNNMAVNRGPRRVVR